MTKAHVLIEARTGHIPDVAAALDAITGLVSVDPVTGPYDIIVVFEAESLGAVGDLVTGHVHTVGGIVRTVTCLAVASGTLRLRLASYAAGRN